MEDVYGTKWFPGWKPGLDTEVLSPFLYRTSPEAVDYPLWEVASLELELEQVSQSDTHPSRVNTAAVLFQVPHGK